MKYPTLEEVEAADRFQLCLWHRRLKSPGHDAVGKENFQTVLEIESAILRRITTRLTALGGFTPEISKQIGW